MRRGWVGLEWAPRVSELLTVCGDEVGDVFLGSEWGGGDWVFKFREPLFDPSLDVRDLWIVRGLDFESKFGEEHLDVGMVEEVELGLVHFGWLVYPGRDEGRLNF